MYKNEYDQFPNWYTLYVVGAGGGIGRAICRVMAREGATVVAADLNINNVQTTVDELTGRIHNLLAIEFSKTNFRQRPQKLSIGCVWCWVRHKCIETSAYGLFCAADRSGQCCGNHKRQFHVKNVCARFWERI